MRIRFLIVLVLLLGLPRMAAAQLQVLCSTFPIYQFTRNIVDGREGVSVALLVPATLGCPHHYALTPQDMRKLERADVLVINGLGLEGFLGAPVKRANPEIRVINSAAGITDLLHNHASQHTHAHDHDHHIGCVNPHVFASPLMATRLIATIADGLSDADPDGAAHYTRNAKAYTERLLALHKDLSATAAALDNRRIVQPHGVFDYLARDAGLEIVAVLQTEGHIPSAAEMLQLVQEIRKAKTGAVFAEPQYPDNAARTVAREAGIAFGILDPAASGPADAPLDYYETVMRRNIATLRRVLGGS